MMDETKMVELDLAGIRARAEAATPNPRDLSTTLALLDEVEYLRSLADRLGERQETYKVENAGFRAFIEQLRQERDYIEERRQYWHHEACREFDRANVAETYAGELRARVMELENKDRFSNLITRFNGLADAQDDINLEDDIEDDTSADSNISDKGAG